MNQWKNYFLCVAVAFLGIANQVQAAQTPSFWGRLGQAVTRFKMRLAAQPTKRLEQAIAAGNISKAQEAIMLGARVNPSVSGLQWSSPLRDAIKRSNPNMVKFLIAAGANVNARAASGTLLESALEPTYFPDAEKRDKIVQNLLEAGANPYLKKSNVVPPIMNSAVMSDPALLKIFLKKDVKQIFQRGHLGKTLLHYVAEEGNIATMNVLVDTINQLMDSAANVRGEKYQPELTILTSSFDQWGRSPYHMIDPKDPYAMEKVELLQEIGVHGLRRPNKFGQLPAVLRLIDHTRK